jgi:hypothetical protein
VYVQTGLTSLSLGRNVTRDQHLYINGKLGEDVTVHFSNCTAQWERAWVSITGATKSVHTARATAEDLLPLAEPS